MERGRLRAANQGKLVNNGTFTVTGNAQVFNYTGGRPAIVNNGTFLKTGGASTVLLPDNSGIAFDNNGVSERPERRLFGGGRRDGH